jgi:putative sterol carrier protein
MLARARALTVKKNHKIDAKEGVAAHPNIMLKMADTNFVAMVNGKLKPVTAFMTGKLEFNGSTTTGLRLLDMGFSAHAFLIRLRYPVVYVLVPGSYLAPKEYW